MDFGDTVYRAGCRPPPVDLLHARTAGVPLDIAWHSRMMMVMLVRHTSACPGRWTGTVAVCGCPNPGLVRSSVSKLNMARLPASGNLRLFLLRLSHHDQGGVVLEPFLLRSIRVSSTLCTRHANPPVLCRVRTMYMSDDAHRFWSSSSSVNLNPPVQPNQNR
eukprot:673710-Rhodomonas_salina.2